MMDEANQSGFQIETRRSGFSQFVVALSGEVDLYAAPELKAELLRLADEGTQKIVVDLTATTFVDSTTLGVLLAAVKHLRPARGEVVIVCSDPNIRRVFEITLLDRVFSIFDTLPAALTADGRRDPAGS